MNFCKDVIYTAQSYDKEQYKRKKYKKYKPQYNKRYSKKGYFLRKSSATKPYLNRDRHVRKYRTDRNYKNKLECFPCGSIEHLANTCPKRYNTKTRNAQLVEEFDEALLNVDENMSDNESIYSVVSIDVEDQTKEEISSNSEGEQLINEIGLEDFKFRRFTS